MISNRWFFIAGLMSLSVVSEFLRVSSIAGGLLLVIGGLFLSASFKEEK